MNLHDIVKRRDPALVVDSGSVDPAHRAGPDGFIGARLAPNTRLRLTGKFTALRLGYPLNWEVIDGQANIETSLGQILVETETGALIKSAGFFVSRDRILPFAIGDGVEIGPGAHPHLKPSVDVRVRYLEDVGKEEWIARYHPDEEPDWDNYLVGDARHLDVADESLDFIYSSHVFEHLMNPLGTLSNWSRKLKPGGSVLAVIPDCRYCFDLRQEPSTMTEIKSEFGLVRWDAPRSKYEKWCAGTALNGDPDDLIRRGYPIHFHYYTPDVFQQLAGKAVELHLFDKFDIWAEPNSKDFAVKISRR